MKIVQKIWVLPLLCCFVTAKKQYQPDPITQTLHYDDDESSSSTNNSPYPQIKDPDPSSYRHPAELPKSHQYTIPTPQLYKRAQYQQQPKLFGYYTSPQGHYDAYAKVKSPEVESKYTLPQSAPQEHYSENAQDIEYKKPVKKSETEHIEEPEELQYSHDSEEHGENLEHPTPYPSQKYGHGNNKHNRYPAEGYGHGGDRHGQHVAPYPSPKRDPKLPLYFTMYEKRIIQDPMDKYGKGPWRYLTYGHGITYGQKEPGKVFERGYGYIRALGRDHCKLPENLCPQGDEKPFEYDGRKEPYFGYRPH